LRDALADADFDAKTLQRSLSRRCEFLGKRGK
jgi:hypothetical protein